MIPKFRAWDKTNNEMLEVGAIDWYLNEATFYLDHKPFFSMKLDCLELMQSTGLLDKNGKEIFEGDILKIQTSDFYSKKINDEYNGIVCFSRGGFFVLTDGYHTDFCLWDKSTGIMKVIGNVYENPELLGDIDNES